MTKKEAIALLDKYLAGECTPEEKLLFDQAYRMEIPLMGKEDFAETAIESKERIWKRLQEQNPALRPARKLWTWVAAAASVLLVLGVFLLNRPNGEGLLQNAGFAKLKPGANKAFLTLSNGKRIALTGAANGTIAQQAGIEITKTADGQIIYVLKDPGLRQDDGGKGRTASLLNTVETPNGGQYQIRLPDGTQIWLNAASELRYPASFASLKERVVELKGEAYFEVAKDKRHPFIVKTPTERIEVLGTHFNINSYTDEPSVKTTLLEGAVKVSSLAAYASDAGRNGGSAVLKPGEQAALTNGLVKVSRVDPALAVGWKEGLFYFKNAPLQEVMRQVARWYDVQVEFRNAALKGETFSGSVSRYDNVSRILNTIEFAGAVKFSIEGRKIIIDK